MTIPREKIVARIDRDLLTAIRRIAEKEGRPLQSIVEDALSDYVEKHGHARPRPQVMSAYQSSLELFGPLFEKLAK